MERYIDKIYNFTRYLWFCKSDIKTIVVNDNLVVLTNNITYSLDYNDISEKGYYVVLKSESGNWYLKILNCQYC